MNELQQKIMKYLQELEPGKVVNIYESPNYDQFVAVTKNYIEQYGDVEFNSTYQKIRKI